MSRTVEQKVVEMRFDNSNFEKNISQSMDSLNKLQNAIDKSSSGTAFAGLSKVLDNINFGSVTTAIQTVTEKFSIWEEIAIGAARNIGAALSNYVVKGMNDMVFRNISAGWDKYATKTEAVQTIMASIADQDFGNVDKMEYVEGLMEKLNWFTDETSFHLTDMISSIGKFTSAGVDLDKASDAMMGIATWAAVSGANADTASRVMYQLSQSLGLGAVRTQDWMSVETANMATKEFKELAIQVAKTKKTLTEKGVTAKGNQVNFQNFRENLKDNWLTSDVLTETLAQYSGFANALNRVYEAYGGNVPTSTLIKRFKLVQAEAKKTGKSLKETFKEKYDVDVNFDITDKEGKVIGDLTKSITELGMRAFIAAQEAKTFKEAMDSVGDAASTVWMRVYETIFGNYEVAKELWTNLANDLYELFVEPIWIASDLFKEWSKQGGRALLFGRQILENDDGTEEIVPTGAFDIFIRGVIDASNALRNGFLTALGYSEDKVSEFTSKTLIKFSQKMLNLSKRFQKFIGNVDDLTEKFSKFFGFFVDIIKSIDVFNKKSEDSVYWVGMIKKRFVDTFTRVENVLDRVKSIVGYIKEGFIEFFKALKFNGGSILNFGDTAENLAEVGNDLAKALSPITLIFKEMGEFGKKTGKFISNLVEALSSVPKEITSILRNTELLSWGANVLQETLKAIKTGFNEAFNASIFADIKEAFKYVWSGIKTFIDGFTSNFNIYDKIKTISKGIASAINLIGRAVQFLLTPIKVLDGMGVFTELGKFFGGTVLNAFMSIPAAIAKLVTNLDDFIKQHPRVQEIWEGIVTIFSSIVKFALTAGNALSNFISRTKPLSKVGQFVNNIFESFKKSEVLTKIGRKTSDAFDKVVKFFRDDFHLDNFKNKIKTISVSIKEFVDKSSLLSKARDKFADLWNKIKGIFSGETDLSGFVSSFDKVASAIGNFVKKIWEGVGNVGRFFIGLFGKNTANEGLDGVEEETEAFSTRIGKLLDGIWKALEWIGSKIKKLFEGAKKLWEELGVGEWFSSLFENVKKIFKDITDKIKPVEGATEDFSEETEATFTGVGNIFKGLAKVFGAAIPTFLAGSFLSGLLALVHPIKSLGEIVNIVVGTVASYNISERIKATGDAISNVVKSLGIFILALAGSAILLSYADSISGGKLDEIYKTLALFIGEVVASMSIILGLLAKTNSLSKISGSVNKESGISAERTKNEMAGTVAALGEVFAEIGKAMLMLAASVAMLVAIDKLNPGSLWTAFGIIEIFLVTLTGIGIAVMKLTEDQKSMGGSLTKAGLTLNGTGYVEGLYLIGSFMEKAATALLMIAAATALVVKASNGDTKTMLVAFGFMEAALLTLVGGALLITKATSKMGSGAETTKVALKLSGFATFFIAAAAALHVIAKTAVMLGKEKESDLDKGFGVILKIGLIFAGLIAVASIAKNGKFGSVGFMMLEAAVALSIIALAVKNISSIDENGMQKAIDILIATGVIFGLLIGVASLSNSGAIKFVAFGAMMIEMASAFLLMTMVVKILSGITSTQLDSVVTGLAAMTMALLAIFAVVALASSNALGILVASAALVAMAVALDLVIAGMVAAGVAFSKNEGSLEKAVGAIALAVAAIAALSLIATLAGPSLLVFGAGLLAIGLGLSAIAASILIVSLALTALTAALKIVLTMGDAIVDAMKTFFKAIAKAAPELTDALIAIVGGIVTAIAENLEGIITIVLSILGRILSAIVEFLPQILENLTIIVNAIVDLLLNVLLHAVDTLLFGESGILVLIDKALNSENGLLAILKRALMGENGVLTIIDEFIHALLESIRGIATDLVDTLVYLMQELVRGVLDNIDIILTGVEDVINQIVQHIISLSDTILGGIVDVIEGIAVAIETHGANIWKAIWHVATAIWNSFWGIFDGDGENSISSLAGNIMEGLGEGIKKFVGKVTTKIQEIGSTIVDKFKSVFGIASPSKVMAEIGNYLDLGLAEGITDNTKPIFTGISGIGDGVIDSLKTTFLGDDASNITGLFGNNLSNSLTDALGGITDVLETDDFTPTITPVLDLSEIQNGASMIPGMIGSGSGYTVDTTAVVKSAYNPYQYYDGTERLSTSDAQLSYWEALKTKMDEVVNKFGNAKVVLDTGAVVGGIVDPMDIALGQRMAQVGRGVISSTR